MNTTDEVLAELRAIRALLEHRADDIARCPHGATGICMSCLTPIVEHALAEARR